MLFQKRGRLLALALVGGSVWFTGGAISRAQSGPTQCEPNESEVEEARALFIAGRAAVDSGRWSDAVSSFQRAYALSCAPSALYNLAIALRALGRHRDSRDAFQRLVDEHPTLREDMRASASQFRDEEAQRVAVLELIGLGAEARHQIVVDGEAVIDEGERPVRIEADAGPHSLTATLSEEYQPFIWNGELVDGQHERINVIFEPVVVDAGNSDWVYVLVPSLIAAAIAGGVIAGIVLYDEAQLQPLNPDRQVGVD